MNLTHNNQSQVIPRNQLLKMDFILLSRTPESHKVHMHGKKGLMQHCNPVQGQYRARTGFSLCSKFSQGKTCFHYREPLFSLQGPCIHYRDFPVRITTQGNPCSHYREWVCSECWKGISSLKSIFKTWFLGKNLALQLTAFKKPKCWKKQYIFIVSDFWQDSTVILKYVPRILQDMPYYNWPES